MLEKKSKNGWRLVPEIGLTALVIAGLINCAIRFHVDGKLPQPFIFDIQDTYMDWFNTAYWAHNKGAFDNWQTVYPPLSFVFLKTFGLSQCYLANSAVARDCDYLGRYVILLCYGLGALTAWLAFKVNDPRTSTVRGIAYGLGLPLLFTLERGNLILPCFVFFALGNSGILKSEWGRAISLGVTINFKPYLLLPVLSNLFRREWRFVEASAIATIAVYIVSFGMFGDGSPMQLVRNTIGWVSFANTLVWEQIYYSTSYAPFLEFNTYRFPTRDFIPYYIIDTIGVAVPLIIKFTNILGLVSLVGAWLQPAALSKTRLSVIILGTYLIGQSPGGYAEVFLVFLVFMERWERPGPIVALICGYLLCIPYDYVISNFITLSGDAWLSGRPVTAPFGISVGIFIRPGLMAIMVWALALDSIAIIVKSHRVGRPVLGLQPNSAGA